MKTNYLYRLIWFGCLSVCLPVILAGIAYYQFSMKQGLAHIQESNAMSLDMIEQFTDKVMSDIVNDSFQLSLEPSVNEFLTSSQYTSDYVSQMELLKKINIYKSKNNYVGDIYIYNRNSGLVLSNDTGSQLINDFKFKDDIDALNKQTGFEELWTYLPVGKQYGYLSIALKLPTLSSDNGQGLLVIQLKAGQIQNYFSNVISLTQSQSILVVDGQHRLMFQTQKTLNPSNKMYDSILGPIFADNRKNNTFIIDDSKGQKQYVSYLKSLSGNVFVSIVPYQAIIDQLSWIKWLTLLAVLLFIGFGVILTVVTTKRAYDPIARLVNYLDQERTSLGEQLSKSVPPLMERLLQQWLGGNYINSRNLYDECRKYGIPLDRNYIVMLVKVEHPFKDQRFSPEDRPMVTFALTNVMSELLANHPTLQGYIIHDQQDHGAAILHFDRNVAAETASLRVRKYAESVHEALLKYLKLQTTVGIGRPYPHIADIRESYQESKLALQIRLYKETESIFPIEAAENSHKHPTFSYPHAIEKSIAEALASGETNKARQLLEQFTEALKASESYSIIYQSYYMLLVAIISSLEHKGGGTPEMLEYDLFDQLRERETPLEMYEWFTETLFPLYEKISDENYSTAGKLVVNKVRSYIMNNISKDISLTECADLFHITPSYLSRLFKKEVGTAFLDFVTECKINEAKRLLKDTDQNISQIASALGYSHRTFNRIFQRVLNVSPSDYRTDNR